MVLIAIAMDGGFPYNSIHAVSVLFEDDDQVCSVFGTGSPTGSSAALRRGLYGDGGL
jgi:hypothetical protein